MDWNSWLDGFALAMAWCAGLMLFYALCLVLTFWARGDLEMGPGASAESPAPGYGARTVTPSSPAAQAEPQIKRATARATCGRVVRALEEFARRRAAAELRRHLP